MALRIIQVGMAAWGTTWAAIVQRSPETALVACVDPNPVALTAISADPTIARFGSLEEALQAVEADAVLITAAVTAHVPLALTALAAGKHVLLEKPFAPTLAEAEQVVAVAAATQRTLMISQNYRFFPAPRTVAALVRGNVLGQIGSITIDFRQNAAALLPPEHALFQMRQPLLAEMAVHHFDLLRMILDDEATQVSCHTWSPPWSALAGPAAATATITCANGTVINYRANWASSAPATPWAGVWRMECEGGEIAWTSRNGRDASADLVVMRRYGEAARRVVLPKFRQLGRESCLAAFVRAIRTRQQPECSGRDNLGTIALMQSAIAAARSGQTVALPPTVVSPLWSYNPASWLSRLRANSIL
ncbi:MAG: Gfo/Idh/MocA family oxidoreductase [Chloroflexi bacterium]|nr:Gfo/Idh/MocA family oxidoreductase [Chloroflexota bacterium]